MRGIYIKFTTGSSEERPCAGVAAFARMENGICRELRLAVGAVSARPVRITAGEEMARDQASPREVIARIAAEAARVVDPIDDVRGPADYKRHLVGVSCARARHRRGQREAEPVMTFVGTNVPMVGAVAKVTGAVNYIANLEFPGPALRQSPAQSLPARQADSNRRKQSRRAVLACARS